MEVQYQRFNSNQSGNCSVTPLPLPQSLYGRTDGRTYGHVITKFSRLGGLPNFLTHGAPLARFARWSSANTQYLDMLPKLVKQYNNTKHSSIKMTPIEASKKKNEGTVYFNLYGDMKPLSTKPKFKVGDKVRISKYKRKVFDKGYTPNWTEEVFTIDKIQYSNPITYKLKDLNNEEIQGSFYEPELLKAKQDVFRIDKVIRRDYKKKQALVKWKGYSDEFNSWIPFKDLQHI